MTVRELIAELKTVNPNLPVRMVYVYPDHWRTLLAKEVTEVAEGAAEMSEYHREYKAVDVDKLTGKDLDLVADGIHPRIQPAVMLG